MSVGTGMIDSELLSDLAPFLDLPVVGTNKKIGDLGFVSAEDKWSTCFFTVASSAVAAGSSAQLFQSSVGETGQGSPAALTWSETNVKGGARQPKNQVYVATRVGFSFYGINTTTAASSMSPIPLNNPATIQSLGLGMYWSLNIADLVNRNIATLIEYPAGSGAWGQSSVFKQSTTAAAVGNVAAIGWANNGNPRGQKRKLPVPVVFPPEINVEIAVTVGSACSLFNNFTGAATTQTPAFDVSGSNLKIAVKCHFQGFRMTAVP